MVAPRSHWVRSRRGLIWRAGNSTRKVDPAGTGSICFEVNPKLSEAFLFSAVTRASHGTDHNDVWVSCSGGLVARKRKGPTKKRFGVAWVKGYQNVGADMWAYGIYTVDHNPHLIYTEVLSAGSAQLCVSGRSSMFELSQLKLTPEGCV